MKNLVIIRHGKAESLKSGQKDFDRNLAGRGKRDAPFIADIIRQKNIKPDAILSSPANRAFQTAVLFSEKFHFPQEQIFTKHFLYEYFQWNELLNFIEEVAGNAETLFVFGHNPTLEELVSDLCPSFHSFLPTCGAAGIAFKCRSWQKLKPGNGNLFFYEYPKKYSSHE